MRKRILTQGPDVRRWILLGLIAGVPLLFVRVTYDPINIPKFSLLLAGVSVVAAIRAIEVMQGAKPQIGRAILVPAIAVTSPLLLAWLFSAYKGWSLFGQYPRLTGLVPYLVVVAFGVLVADAFAGRATPIAWALLVAGGVAGAYAVIQAVGLDPFSWSVKGGEVEVIASTLGNPNFAGAFLGIALPSAVYLVASDPERRRFSIPLGLLSAAGCLLARSEGGYAAAAAGVAIVAGFLLSTRFKPARTLGVLAAAAIALAAVSAVVLFGLRDATSTSTLARRAQWWEAAADMGMDSPLVGSGPGSFAIEHAEYRTFEDARQVNFDITDDPHSVVLSFFAGAGILGAAGILVAFGWIALRGWRLGPEALLGGAMFGTCAAYLVQALISIDTVALRTTFWAAAGGLVASTMSEEQPIANASRSRKKKMSAEPLRNPIGVTVVALVAVAGLWIAGKVLASDKAFADSLAAVESGDVAPAQQEYDSATSLRSEVFYRRSYGRGVGNLAVALAEAGQEEPARVLLDSARDAFAFVEDLPHSNSIVDLARVLRDAAEVEPGAAEESLDLYRKAASIDRFNAPLLGEASTLALELEQNDVVVDLLADFPALGEDSQLLGNLALAYVRLDQQGEAREAATAALQLEPTQPQALEAARLLETQQ